MDSRDERCPDGGYCHHDCPELRCFRVRCCGPLSNVFPEDRWPLVIKQIHSQHEDVNGNPIQPTIEDVIVGDA